jgi:hypothetical protein
MIIVAYSAKIEILPQKSATTEAIRRPITCLRPGAAGTLQGNQLWIGIYVNYRNPARMRSPTRRPGLDVQRSEGEG